MARRTYIEGKWRDIYGKKPDLYYIIEDKKISFDLSPATKSFMKRFNKKR